MPSKPTEQTRRRVALVIHALSGGGAERIISQLASRWAAAGHDVVLITLAATSTDKYPLHSTVRRIGLDLLQASSNKLQALGANYRRVRKLRAALYELAPDRIVSFCDRMNIVTLLASKRLNIPIWICERSDPSKQKLGWIWEWARRRSYPSCTGCVVQSETVKRYLSAWVADSKLRVIPNAVDVPINLTTNASVRLDTEHSNTKKVLSVGRLSAEKGFDTLLLAWSQVHTSIPEWKLVLAGDGAERHQLQSLAQELKIADSVQFLGWCDNPWPLYDQADMYVLPSRYEGFPVALLEAMSMGKPCIATRCSETVELLSENGRAIECVEVGDSDSLARSIRTQAMSPETRLELGQSAKRIAQKFTWHSIGPMWDQILE